MARWRDGEDGEGRGEGEDCEEGKEARRPLVSSDH